MDGIPVRFIKLYMPFILHYITHIFNTILSAFYRPLLIHPSNNIQVSDGMEDIKDYANSEK
jgi:hypothetical protein